jgi:A/G-specific adenine glycosylase
MKIDGRKHRMAIHTPPSLRKGGGQRGRVHPITLSPHPPFPYNGRGGGFAPLRLRAQLHVAVFRWYSLHGRTLPWRGIRNAYRIMISEIMLQQTQVSRVLEKYPLFLKQYPTLGALAAAPRAMVIRSWQGMGYNNRAVRLHMLAQVVMENHRGKLPREYDALVALPGIGRYTAQAILSSAFDEKVAIVDVNIRRLFSRIFWSMPDRAAMRPEQEIWQLAEMLLPRRNVYDWNQALMDLGATVCTARTPQCERCPLTRFCRSRKQIQSSPLRASASSPLRAYSLPTSRASSISEPSYRNIPTRIHRGKIIEALRGVSPRKTISVTLLAQKIFAVVNEADVNWMKEVLKKLEADGLVKETGGRVGLQ